MEDNLPLIPQQTPSRRVDLLRPNILFILVDQHRGDCLPAYGNPDLRTPCLDALGEDGVIYDRAYCVYPVCTPSRYSLLSGLHVHQHLGWSNHCTLPPGLPTWPRLLRDQGYRTGAIGKMHFTPTYLDVGFDQMCLAEQNGPGRYEDDYHRWLHDQGLVDATDLIDQEWEYRQHAGAEYWDTCGAQRSNLDEAHHSTTWIGDRAIETLQTWEAGGSQAMMVSFIKPHHPFDPPAPWDSMYDPARIQLPAGWTDTVDPDDLSYQAGYFPHEELTPERVRRATAYYYATLSQIDHHVGRCVDVLKQRGLYDDTLIIYHSDHGDYLGYRHLLLKGNRMYEPLMRVPLILKWPQQLQAGTRCGELVCGVDLAPTLVSAAGGDIPDSWPGIDLASGETRQVVFAEVDRGREYMVRGERYKLLLCRDRSQSRLFDLTLDPHERANLFDQSEHAQAQAEMETALWQWLAFETPTPVHLDEHAPVLDGTNVPTDDGHWQRNYDDFATAMRQHIDESVEGGSGTRS